MRWFKYRQEQSVKVSPRKIVGRPYWQIIEDDGTEDGRLVVHRLDRESDADEIIAAHNARLTKMDFIDALVLAGEDYDNG